MLVFEERGKAEYPEKKPLGANSTHIMASTPGFEPGPHWGEASALITAQFLPLRSNGRKLVGQQSFERNNVGSVCKPLPTLIAQGPRTQITHGLQSLMGCILPTMHCRYVCTPLATRRLKTPNIVDPVRLYIVLTDNTDRVREKFCTVIVVFV